MNELISTMKDETEDREQFYTFGGRMKDLEMAKNFYHRLTTTCTNKDQSPTISVAKQKI